jgi:hypothetical protein
MRDEGAAVRAKSTMLSTQEGNPSYWLVHVYIALLTGFGE